MIDVATTCQCFTCRHPSDDNAVDRAVHAARHEQFAELVAERTDVRGFTPLSRFRRLQVIAQEHDPDCLPVRVGHCRMREHANMPAHPANHR